MEDIAYRPRTHSNPFMSFPTKGQILNYMQWEKLKLNMTFTSNERVHKQCKR